MFFQNVMQFYLYYLHILILKNFVIRFSWSPQQGATYRRTKTPELSSPGHTTQPTDAFRSIGAHQQRYSDRSQVKISVISLIKTKTKICVSRCAVKLLTLMHAKIRRKHHLTSNTRIPRMTKSPLDCVYAPN